MKLSRCPCGGTPRVFITDLDRVGQKPSVRYQYDCLFGANSDGFQDPEDAQNYWNWQVTNVAKIDVSGRIENPYWY